jgi:hypothetical protein
MNKVYLVMNFDAREVMVFEKKPHVRKYELEHPDAEILVQECDWHYKSQLVELMNKFLYIGQTLGDWLQPSVFENEDEEDDEPDDDPMWADADALASAGHGMDEDYM